MKKSLCLFVFLCIITLSVLSFGCSMAQEQKTATIELEANATTGYTWVYTMSPERLLQIVELLDIIELSVADSNGIITASSVPKYIGFDYKLYDATKE